MFGKNLNKIKIIHAIELIIFDAFSIFASYAITLILLRLVGMDISILNVLLSLPLIIAVKIFIFYLFGFYKMLLSHTGFEDILKIVAVVLFTNLIIMLYLLFYNTDLIHPMALFFVGLFELVLVSLPRVAQRVWMVFKTNLTWRRSLGNRTMIVGAGAGGELVMKEIYKNPALKNIPVAFIDDDISKIGSKMMGVDIVGPVSKLASFIEIYNIEEVIIAIANMSIKELHDMVNIVADKNIKLKRLPLMTELDKNKPAQIMDVKLEDLLNRDTVNLDNEHVEQFIEGKTVLVTGGGGSIGSELCRQIALYNPKHLIIFDIYENNAYEIQMELQRKYKKKLQLTVLIGSVYNKARLETVFNNYKIDVVFHAAAYKHVPLMEDSPIEAVRTNVLGTYNTAMLAGIYNVQDFVLVSSDKAVRPTNVMGATKRFAELIIQAMNKQHDTKYNAVRFGNVLGSNGSVIPLFKKQIEDGGPVTVTHKDITRYFMTIPEAVSLILQSAVFSEGGEIFILDMGEAVKIKDLAEKMIRLSGFKPYKDIDITYTGLRPGEKLFEELLIDDHALKTTHDKIFIETSDFLKEDSLNDDDYKDFIHALKEEDMNDVKMHLKSYIKTYKESSGK